MPRLEKIRYPNRKKETIDEDPDTGGSKKVSLSVFWYAGKGEDASNSANGHQAKRDQIAHHFRTELSRKYDDNHDHNSCHP